MNTTSKTRVLPLIAAVTLIAAAACADSTTAPQVVGKRAVRDTTIETDSSSCLRGFVILNGRVSCT